MISAFEENLVYIVPGKLQEQGEPISRGGGGRVQGRETTLISVVLGANLDILFLKVSGKQLFAQILANGYLDKHRTRVGCAFL